MTTARELHDALDLLARVEDSEDELVREINKVKNYGNQGEQDRLLWERAAAALVALRAERDELKRHAEAMATHLNEGIQVDVDPEDGTQSPRSEWDFVANELVAAYRAAHPKEES